MPSGPSGNRDIVFSFEFGDDADGEAQIDSLERKGYRIVSYVPFADPTEGRIDVYVAMARPTGLSTSPN